jgi:hypothetical protein
MCVVLGVVLNRGRRRLGGRILCRRRERCCFTLVDLSVVLIEFLEDTLGVALGFLGSVWVGEVRFVPRCSKIIVSTEGMRWTKAQHTNDAVDMLISTLGWDVCLVGVGRLLARSLALTAFGLMSEIVVGFHGG